LSSRVGALQRKLATEVKIRDAAQTLARLNTFNSSPSHISRQSSSALEIAERKVAAAQTELWRLQERAANVGRRLLEHRAGVLSAALTEAERAQANGLNISVTDTDISFRSSVSSASSLAVTTPKFDGAHFFAGHKGAIVPGKQSRGADPVQDSGSGGGGGASQQELEELTAKLAAAEALAQEREAQLEDARIAAASDLENARAVARKEIADARAEAASEAAWARERAGELEERVARLQRELETSTRGKDDAAFLGERIRTLERELEDTRSKSDQARRKIESAWSVEKSAWASERALLEQERGKWAATATTAAGLEEKLEKERALWEQEREEVAERAKDQIADAADGLRALVQRFDIPLFSRGSGLGVLVDALGRHLEKHNAQVHEELLVAEVDKRSAMAQELEDAKVEIQSLQAHLSSTVSALHIPIFVVKNANIKYVMDYHLL
jgi:Uds1 (Up-regulated during septation)-like protein